MLRPVRKEGDVIGGRFRLLGQRPIIGGMGVVWRALDEPKGTDVAIKFVSSTEPNTLERFEREIHILQTLDHPHIVRYVDHGITNDAEPWLAMEWLDGRGLDVALRTNGALRVDEAVRLGQRVAQALGAAHAERIVHRDVKPTNIYLVGEDCDRVKVLDFGIALLADRRMTSHGIIVGTVGYMAPEQIEDDGRDVDARADVFCLGIVLFECLTGRKPFEGGPQQAIFAKTLIAEVPRVVDLRADVPAALSDLVARMLAKGRDQRPPNGAAVAAALEAITKPVTTLPPSSAQPKRAAPRITSFPPPSPLDARAVRIPQLPPPPSERLSPQEKQLLFLVAAKPESEARRQEREGAPPTLARGMRLEIKTALRAGLDPKNERLHELPGGALLITVQGRGNPTEIAGRAARLALLVGKLSPSARVAVVAARAEANDKMPVGTMLDGVFRLVDLPADVETTDGQRPARIDDVTRALLDARFDIASKLGEYWLRGEREVTRAVRTLLGKPSPFIGRDKPLASALMYVEEAFGRRHPAAVLVLGDAGAGKSRLRFELVERLSNERPEVKVVLGRGDPLRAESAFSIVGSALRSAAGISSGEPLDVSQDRLRTLVGTYLAGEDKRRVSEFLGEVVGTHFPDAGRTLLRAARKDATLMADRIQEAFFEFVAAFTERSPLLLVLEELEWGDAASLKLVDEALDALSGHRFAVLALAQSDIGKRRPGLWEGRNVQFVRLNPLHPDDAARLVLHALGPQVAPSVVRRIVDLGAGNVFYLEELIRAVNEGRGDALPETVLGMVDARIASKSLDEGTRKILRAASIFGEAAWEGGLRALIDGPIKVEESLALLCKGELLVRRSQSRFAGETEYTFRHPLLREAAYARLTDDDRRLGHKLAAEWLCAAREQDPSVLAQHFERGGEPARAVEYYVQAAEQALSGGALEAAIRLAERGLGLGASGEAAAELWAIATDAESWRSNHARAYEAARHAFEVATPGSRHHARALGSAIRSAQNLDDPRAVSSLGERLLREDPTPDAVLALSWAFHAAITWQIDHDPAAAMPYLGRMERVTAAAAERDPAVAAWTLHTRAHWARAIEQDPWTALVLDRESVQRFGTIGDRRYLPYAQVHVGLDYILLGAHDTALAALGEGLREQPEGSLPSIVGNTFRALLLLERGALAPARDEAREVAVIAEERGERLAARSARLVEARASVALSDLDAAEETLDAIERTGSPSTALLGTRAALRLAQGKADEALDLAVCALARRPSRDARVASASPELALVHAEALFSARKPAEGRAALEAARSELSVIAEGIRDPSLRQTFLERRPACARILALCAERLAG